MTSNPKPNTPVTDPGYGGSTTHIWPLSFGFSQTLETVQSISATGSGQKTAPDGSYSCGSTRVWA